MPMNAGQQQFDTTLSGWGDYGGQLCHAKRHCGACGCYPVRLALRSPLALILRAVAWGLAVW